MTLLMTRLFLGALSLFSVVYLLSILNLLEKKEEDEDFIEDNPFYEKLPSERNKEEK